MPIRPEDLNIASNRLMLPTPTMLSVFSDDAHLVVLFRVGVKRGVISSPADLVLTPGMSHEITPSWI